MITYLFSQPLIFVTWVLAFLVALAIHEFSHALLATFLGDSTAKRMGRLTLNPAAHVDMIGLFAVILIGFGWGKPVPYNPYNLKWPKWGPVAIAFAGPASNLLLALISIILLTLLGSRLGPNNLLTILLLISSQLNIALFVFNLIPIPPLDGSKALLALLAHPKYAQVRMLIETRGPGALLLFIVLDSVLNLGIFSAIFTWASGLIMRIAALPFPGL